MIVLVAAYLIGSIPFALICARRWGAPDLRLVGSGNLGAANVMRTSGVTAGVVVAALDMAKGAVSVWMAERLGSGPGLLAAAGLAAIVGHIYPVWLRFRGGKGVATACGVFSVLAPLALPPLAYALGASIPAVVAACAAATIIVFRHRSNVGRLRTGTERRLGVRA